jgi:hypothetical protein
VTPQEATGYSKRQAGKVIDRLLTKQVGGEYRMPFGEHRGKALKDLPGGYLRWLESNVDSPRVKQNLAIMRGETVSETSASSVFEEAPF